MAGDLEPSPEVVTMVTNALYLLLLLEHVRPSALAGLSVSTKMARIMCVFLIGELDGWCVVVGCFSIDPPTLSTLCLFSLTCEGNTLFLEEAVHNCLLVLLRLYCQPEAQRSMDFNVPIPGLASFHGL